MISYSHWLDENFDKLEEEYQKYLEELENNDLFIVTDFDEFCSDKFESYIGDLEDMAYENLKDSRNV